MKIVYFANSSEYLDKNDLDLFECVVGGSLLDLEKEIKNSSDNLINRIYSNEKFIYSERLNNMGLHIYRTLLSNKIYQKRKKVYNEAIECFDKEGYMLIENFLPEKEFKILKELFDVRIKPKYPNGIKKQVDATGFFNRNKDFYNLILQCGHVKSFSPDAPYGIPRTEFWNHFHEKGDSQYKLHSDTFQPTCKFWLYLEDIEMEQGPLTLVPGSHICDEKRLKWDFENSLLSKESDLWIRRIEEGGKPGSFRVFENSTVEEETTEVLRLGYQKPVPMVGKKNTLLAANTFCFHKRGMGVEGSYRRTLTSQYRPVAFGVY
tara:strand:- start:1476 stop:2432 length:957 start_codon:yes stop_codon:yes gene_type:complete